jgi:MFS family permease
MTARRVLAYRWELIGLLWFAFFLNQADRQVFNVVLPLIQADLRLTSVQLGMVASVFTLVLGLLVPVAGYTGDTLDKKWIVCACLAFWSVATVCTAWAAGLLHLLLFRSLATGGGEAFYGPAANALIGEHHRETRAMAMSIHQTSLYVGVVASGWLAGWMGEHYGWRHAFLVFGSAGVLLAGLLVWRLRSAPPVRLANQDLPGLREIGTTLRRKPTMVALVLAFAGMVFVNVGYLTWTPTFFHEKFQMTLTEAGFRSMFYHHGPAFAGVLLGGWLSDRFAGTRARVRLEIQAASLLAGAPFIFLTGTLGSMEGSCMALAGFGLFRGLYDSNIYAALFEVIEPRYRASACSVLVCVAFVAAALSPVLLGWAKGTVGLSAGIASLSLVYVFSGISVIVGLSRYFERDRVREERVTVHG